MVLLLCGCRRRWREGLLLAALHLRGRYGWRGRCGPCRDGGFCTACGNWPDERCPLVPTIACPIASGLGAPPTRISGQEASTVGLAVGPLDVLAPWPPIALGCGGLWRARYNRTLLEYLQIAQAARQLMPLPDFSAICLRALGLAGRVFATLGAAVSGVPDAIHCSNLSKLLGQLSGSSP